MAGRIRLVLLTPEERVVDEEVLEVTAPGAYGQINVLPEHAALVTTLEAGTISYKTASGSGSFEIGGGFAEVRDDVMTVLATAANTA